MGYCYTRDVGPVRARRRHGRPPGRRGRLAARAADAGGDVPARAASRRCNDPLRFLHDAIVAGHHQLLRYATQKALIDTPRTTVVACRAAGQRRLLGALRRLAPVHGARRQADRAHARPLVFRAAADDEPGRADGRPLQPQRALHLPRQPRQAGGRHRRPAADAGRRPAPALLRRPLGHGRATARSPISCRRRRSPTRCPSWSSRRCATAAPSATTSRCSRWSGKAPRTTRRPRHPDRQRSARRCSPRRSRPACSARRAPDELDDAEIERSINEINEAIKRSSSTRSPDARTLAASPRQSPP